MKTTENRSHSEVLKEVIAGQTKSIGRTAALKAYCQNCTSPCPKSERPYCAALQDFDWAFCQKWYGQHNTNTVNPITTFAHNMVGMACMGIGYESKQLKFEF